MRHTPGLLRRLAPPAPLAVPFALLALFAACQKASGPERVEALRAKFEVRLNGFVVREAPVAAPVAATEATPAPDSAAGEPAALPAEGAAEAAAGAAPEAAPVAAERDVVLDLLVHNDSRETLPGITVDVSQAGEDEVEKAHFRVWVDTSRIAPGQSTQVSHVLEGVPFAPGDRFAVEVVSPVPAEQRGEYREFAGG